MAEILPVELYAYCYCPAQSTRNLGVDDFDESVKLQQISTDKCEKQLDLGSYCAVRGLTVDGGNDIADKLNEIELLLVYVV